MEADFIDEEGDVLDDEAYDEMMELAQNEAELERMNLADFKRTHPMSRCYF